MISLLAMSSSLLLPAFFSSAISSALGSTNGSLTRLKLSLSLEMPLYRSAKYVHW